MSQGSSQSSPPNTARTIFFFQVSQLYLLLYIKHYLRRIYHSLVVKWILILQMNRAIHLISAESPDLRFRKANPHRCTLNAHYVIAEGQSLITTLRCLVLNWSKFNGFVFFETRRSKPMSCHSGSMRGKVDNPKIKRGTAESGSLIKLLQSEVLALSSRSCSSFKPRGFLIRRVYQRGSTKQMEAACVLIHPCFCGEFWGAVHTSVDWWCIG